MAECYINDIFTQTVDLPESNNVKKGERGVLLIIQVLARALARNEPIPRETMAAMAKLFAEARMTEIKIMLGWLLNLRRLIISLPDNKASAWAQ